MFVPSVSNQFGKDVTGRAPGKSCSDIDEKHGQDCHPDDPEKKAYCCPMCGYQGPDLDAFVPIVLALNPGDILCSLITLERFGALNKGDDRTCKKKEKHTSS